jgi:NADPH:quinone reductase-like Zn-dependent oxidoreductase
VRSIGADHVIDYTQEDFTRNGQLEADKVTPVIDHRFPLRDVADAIRYLEAGHAQGKVVITVEQNNTSL